MSHLVILDNEAVQALGEAAHPKHARVLSHLQVITQRTRRALPIQVVVPTAVRVEVGWSRTAPGWAFANRLRIADVPLDARHANAASGIRSHPGISVADAHIGAVIQLTAADRVTVLTSDPIDMKVVAGTVKITVVAI